MYDIQHVHAFRNAHAVTTITGHNNHALFRDSKTPPIRCAAEQPRWDPEHTRAHAHTAVHTDTKRAAAGSHLGFSDVERKHLVEEGIRDRNKWHTGTQT